jgi:hemoglobin
MSGNTHAAAPSRDLIVADLVARTGIDEPMIDRLVRAFYGRARLDPLLGPVFEHNVHDWEGHLGRICAFWSSVALMSGRYRGQPMLAHQRLPIDTPHFDRWLEIFAETAQAVCPAPAASWFLERAYRIAESLELGIATQKGEIRPKRLTEREPPVIQGRRRTGGRQRVGCQTGRTSRTTAAALTETEDMEEWPNGETVER